MSSLAQRVRPFPLDLGLAFDELKAVSRRLGLGSGSISGYETLETYLSHTQFLGAMEHLDWWGGELNPVDKKETALALGLADQLAHPKKRLTARKALPQGVTKRGFILAMEYLPCNLPEWPVSFNPKP